MLHGDRCHGADARLHRPTPRLALLLRLCLHDRLPYPACGRYSTAARRPLPHGFEIERSPVVRGRCGVT
jgi:hypothetical protein